MDKLIKFFEFLGKLVIIGFTMVISFFGTAIFAGILKALVGIDITFGVASIIILMITIGSTILLFRKKDYYSIFIEIQEEEQEQEYQVQSEKLKTNNVNVEEEYINYFGF